MQYVSYRMQYRFWPFKISLGFDPDNHLDPQGGKMKCWQRLMEGKQSTGRDYQNNGKNRQSSFTIIGNMSSLNNKEF